jgi:cytochrome d ubiquinol oxidase subunit II
MALELLVALGGLAALIAYALLGGADFGGGVWDLLAVGPRAKEHRRAISEAMGPVWEANHVWLIFLIVLLFSCFPPAFAALSTALFVPLHLALIGIVLRGSAFVFRAHAAAAGETDPRWTHVFGIASSVTPFLLGMCLAAISSGRLRVFRGEVLSGAWAPWLSPLAWMMGGLSLSICAYVAAIYLTLETDGEAREDFRRRALGAGAVMAALAVLTPLAAVFDAPRFLASLAQPRSAPILIAGAALAALSTWWVYTRRYQQARIAAAAQVTMLVLGWAAAQFPYLIYPDLTLEAAASPDATLEFVLWTLVPGGLLLIPSLALLFRVFKGGDPLVPGERERTAD